MQNDFTHPTDACAQRLHELGYGYGDYSTAGLDGRVWSVYAHQGERRIAVHSVTLVDAYRQAVKQATLAR